MPKNFINSTQDRLLERSIRKNKKMTLALNDKLEVKGLVLDYDNSVILVETAKERILFFKQGLSNFQGNYVRRKTHRKLNAKKKRQKQ